MQFYTTTELRYIAFTAIKNDMFIVHDPKDLPISFLGWTYDNVYDWLNENGYWESGELEITYDQQVFIEVNQLDGMQDEVVVAVEIKM
jgi:hypothetical protein